MKQIKIVVLGEPMGKQRPKFSNANGFVKTYTPKETANYESLVRQAYLEQAQKENFTPFEPNKEIYAIIHAYFKIPKSHYKLRKKTGKVELDKKGQEMAQEKILPTKKPDCDNIAKICLDGLNGVAFYDDSQVVYLAVSKMYSDNHPRVEISLIDYDEGENE